MVKRTGSAGAAGGGAAAGGGGLPRPTEGELAILRVLWERGASTVREVHAGVGKETAYTTALKLLQIMTEKGLVRREEAAAPARGHIYAAAEPAQATQRALLKNLLEKAFGGSSGRLVLQALSAKRATAEELKEIRKLLDGYEKKGERP